MKFPYGLVMPDFSYLFYNPIIMEQERIALVPLRIGHKYKPLRVIDLEELYSTFRNHKRLRVFANKGLKCEYCEKRGFYLIQTVDKGGAIHVDLYTREFEMMTIDHVYPKSKGGKNTLENLVPCCNICNTKKSDKLL